MLFRSGDSLFHAVHTFFLLYSVFCGVLANNTIPSEEKKVDRELQSKTEKFESKNESFYIVTLRGLWEKRFVP